MQTSFTKIYMALDRCAWAKIGNADVLPTNFSYKEITNPSYELYRKYSDLVGAPYDWHKRPRIQNRTLIENLLTPPLSQFFVFLKNENTIGYCLIEAPTSDNAVEISDFGFYPEYTNKGMGQLFFPTTLEKAFTIRDDIEQVILSTRSTNHTKVSTFYEKFGFTIAKTEEVIEDILEPDTLFLNKNYESEQV